MSDETSPEEVSASEFEPSSVFSSEPEISDSLRMFGAVLKFYRIQAGLTQEQFAPIMDYSVPMVASIEQGRRMPPPGYAERANEKLNAGGAILVAAKYVVRKPVVAKWFRQWANLERQASTLYTYENRLVAGLLQTEAYARTLFEEQVPALGDAEIDALLVTRLERAKLLTERPNTTYSFIIEEHVLRRPTGGPEVMREQIDHLLDLAARRNIDIQIMPMSRGHHAGLDGPMRLLETQENKWYAYCEGQRTSHLLIDPKEVSILQRRYARMQSQALSPEESVSLLREIRGAL